MSRRDAPGGGGRHSETRQCEPTARQLSLLSFTLLVGLYSISFWLPQIIKSFSGLDNVEVAILSAIPYMAATVAMVIAGAHSDRSRERCLHIAGAALIGAAGLATSAYVYSPVTGLIALSVATAGIFSAIPIFWSLPTAFLRGTAAAGAIALINSLGNLGRFVGPYLIGRVHDATGSFAISLLSIAALLLSGAGLALSLRRTPANADASLAVSTAATTTRLGVSNWPGAAHRGSTITVSIGGTPDMPPTPPIRRS